MSASSSAASSSLTRSRTAVLVVGVLAAAYGIYYYHSVVEFDLTSSNAAATGLHRSNAISRRQRRIRTNEGVIDTEASEESGGVVFLEDEVQEPPARPQGDGVSVVPETVEGSVWSGTHWDDEPQSQRNGQHIVQLLFRVSEDATRRNAYVHRACQCNACGTVPIRGIRYRCSNCVDFDLCETCEAQGVHTKTHIFYKVRVPTTAFTPTQMHPAWYPGDPDNAVTLPKELITKLSKETGFERPELDAYWEQWTFMANTVWRDDPDGLQLAMDRKTFNQCLVPSAGNKLTPNLLHDRMFAFYDQNNDDLISFPEYLNGLAYRRKKEKLPKVFEGYDINGDGFVDRKDFLRLFRAYYVLYKQMHRDMLDGVDAQVMNSTEAHALVTGRQPLSSAFGRDGNFPRAPDPRNGEGKMPGDYGDLEIVDGKGVVNESGHDFGNRQDVLIEAAAQEYHRRRQSDPWNPTSGNTYWRAVTEPPATIIELQNGVLEGLIRERHRRNANQFIEESDPLPPLPASGDFEPVNENMRRLIQDENWPPDWIKLSDVHSVCGDEATFESIDKRSRYTVLMLVDQRLKTLELAQQTNAVKDDITQRWKRRQFYTDEEEGGVAPSDYDEEEEEDVPHLNVKASESSKEGNGTSQPVTPRSRSSSKVRFADDDDYDTRSNASTSSRSIAERWGGMEIPEAEKDAGKEILYQVTQQAFNELLDPMFKKKEDLAMAAWKSKDIRDRYRHLLTNELYDGWASEVEKTLKKSNKGAKGQWTKTEADMREWRTRPTIPEIELPDVRQRNIEELLAVTGYTVDESSSQSNDENPQISGMMAYLLATPKAQESDSLQGERDSAHSVSASENAEPDAYRDPTMPQFRPNTVDETLSSPLNSYLEPAATISQARSSSASSLPEAGTSKTDDEPQDSVNRNDAGTRVLNHLDITLNQDAIADPVPFADQNSAQSRTSPRHTPSQSPLRREDIEYLERERAVVEIRENFLRSPPPEYESPLPARNASIQRLDSLAQQSASNTAEMSKLENAYIIASKIHALERMPKELQERFVEVDWMELYKLREIENAEKEAETRGGWGRINWKEFEALLKGGEWNDGKSGRRDSKMVMEYLGSWIEFCIPQ
jgi:hypothetical protein